MDEKTKNVLSYVLAILIVGGIITCIVVYPRITLTWFFDIVLTALGLLILCFIVSWLKELLYDFFDSDYFEEIYRKYKSKQNKHNT